MSNDKDRNEDEKDDGFKVEIDIQDDVDNASDTDESQQDEENTELDKTVLIDDRDYTGSVRLVGTVHVSPNSRDLVKQTIREDNPDIVAIELDAERMDGLYAKVADVVNGETEDDDSFGVLDLVRLQLEDQVDETELLESGLADMYPAIETAMDTGSDVALVDMGVSELRANVKENFSDTSLTDVGSRLRSLPDLIQSRSDMAETFEEGGLPAVIEKMENEPAEKAPEQLEPLRGVAPEVVEALLDRRDAHMAGHLHWLRQNGQQVTAVMGRAHQPGVQEYLGNPETIPERYVTAPEEYEYTTIDL